VFVIEVVVAPAPGAEGLKVISATLASPKVLPTTEEPALTTGFGYWYAPYIAAVMTAASTRETITFTFVVMLVNVILHC